MGSRPSGKRLDKCDIIDLHSLRVTAARVVLKRQPFLIPSYSCLTYEVATDIWLS